MAGYQIVSIGPACCVKYQIDHYTQRRQETYLFDWQMVDLPTVSQILAEPDPSRLFRRDALEIYGNNATQTHIRVTTLPKFKSIHDVVYPWTEASLSEYVEKQQRRLRRLRALIQAGTPIYFVHYGQPSLSTITEFEAAIRTVNPTCLYWIFCVGGRTGILSDRVAEIHLERVLDVPTTMPAWSKPELNWERLFLCIFKMDQGSSLAEAFHAVTK
jgi:hypothetical protein